MTSRERMLTAIKNQKPDRIPVAPDISAMVPTRLSGKGFFGVFIHNDPPLWKAYIDAIKYYGMDGWFTYGGLEMITKDVTITEKWILDTTEKKIKEYTYHTPGGDLTEQLLFSLDKPPLKCKRMVEDIEKDWSKLKYLFGEIIYTNDSMIRQQRKELGELGVLGCGIATPGFQIWNDYFEGGIQTLSYLTMDHPKILDELRELQHQRSMQELGHLIKAKPDFILTGGSGSITMASPELWAKYSFPTLKEQCDVCTEQGILTMVHSCGKEKYIVEKCAGETQLNCINPLEIPPMGDITLAEAKKIVKGTRLSLMGNLHTTNIMYMGTAEEVKSAARKAIDDAGQDGGFILSTGDQCGRDTPDENIFALVEVAEMDEKYH